MDESELETEANSIQELLKSKTVDKVYRHRSSEICIEFSDGSRFFVNCKNGEELDFSITGGRS